MLRHFHGGALGRVTGRGLKDALVHTSMVRRTMVKVCTPSSTSSIGRESSVLLRSDVDTSQLIYSHRSGQLSPGQPEVTGSANSKPILTRSPFLSTSSILHVNTKHTSPLLFPNAAGGSTSKRFTSAAARPSPSTSMTVTAAAAGAASSSSIASEATAKASSLSIDTIAASAGAATEPFSTSTSTATVDSPVTRPEPAHSPFGDTVPSDSSLNSLNGGSAANATPVYAPARHYDVPSYVGQGLVLASQVREYARRDVTPTDLRKMLEEGQRINEAGLLKNAAFLCRELPIRLAKRIVELESLPYGLSSTNPVLKVRKWYEDSFLDIMSATPPRTAAEDLLFTDMLERILKRHADVVPTLAKGVLTIKENLVLSSSEGTFDCPFLSSFLDRFYMSRISIRMLISQHCALHYPRDGFCGVIALRMNPVDVARVAISDASRLCERALGTAPEVNIIVDGINLRYNETFDESTETLAYIPSHLHHMLFELLKNSMRAVVEFHGPNAKSLPDIDIVFVSGQHDFSIKVSDQGGGIPRKHMDRIWTYLHTTAAEEVQKALLSDENLSGSGLTEAPLAGFGYGLPLSRLFARYFGGDLQLISMHGYGTDAFLWLHKLVNNTTAKTL